MKYITLAKIIIFCILTVIVATIVTDQIKRYECSTIKRLPTYAETLSQMKGFRFIDESCKSSALAIAKYKLGKSEIKDYIKLSKLSDYALYKFIKNDGYMTITHLNMINSKDYKDVVDGYDIAGERFYSDNLKARARQILIDYPQPNKQGGLYSNDEIKTLSDIEVFNILIKEA